MSDVVEHGPKGGIGGIEFPRRLGTLDGSEASPGKRYIDLPVWFTRTGRRSFTVDSGFGIVRGRAVDFTEADVNRVQAGDAKGFKTLIGALVDIPETWVFEEDTVLGKTQFKQGGEIPQPGVVSDLGDAACADYFKKALPPSLVTQLAVALRFMQMPPIAYTEASSD